LKSPGKDGIHNYWIKKLTNLHPALCRTLNEVLEGDIPEWLLAGRTVLLQKGISADFDPNNYRPITCLSNLWKVFSGIISDKIYDHLLASNLFPTEQKGSRTNVLGTKDQLLINKAVMDRARQKRRNLSTCWVDYKKAYDSVSHEWLVSVLNLMKIDPKVVSLLTAAMQKYRTTLVCDNSEIGEVKISRGIFQGDSLSPLLFVMALFPLSQLLATSNRGFKYNKSDPNISHLWFVDDLKLYAKSEDEMKGMIRIVEMFSKDIGMAFGINKCKWCKVQKGTVVQADSIQTEFGEIQALEEQGECYKYLGILEREGVAKAKMKDLVKGEYKRRVRCLLRSALNSKNLCLGINTYAVSVVRYSAAILDWTQEEIDKLDRSTRKWMALHGAMNLNSDTDRLYVPRRRGGKGLMSIKDTMKKENHLVSSYLKKHKHDRLLKYCSTARDEAGMEITSKQQLKEKLIEAHEEDWKRKKLHGKYFRKVEELQVADHAWLREANFKKETEALLMAAQEQSLRLNFIKFSIDHTVDNGNCRMCGMFPETVQHVVCGCPQLAKVEYLVRHDRMGKTIHWALARKWGFETQEKYYNHTPERVLENRECKILWDFPIRTDKTVRSHRPDVTLVMKNECKCVLVDFSIPFDFRVKEKSREKIEKYQDLAWEIKRLWKMNKVDVVPIIVGALGSMCREDMKKQLGKLGISHLIQPSTLQKEALLGTARILRKTLNV
jgi:hypothetical protein